MARAGQLSTWPTRRAAAQAVPPRDPDDLSACDLTPTRDVGGFRVADSDEAVGLSMLDPILFNSLRRFRAGVYGAFGDRRDALFDLLDAATVAGLVPSLAYLSLTAVHRRGWGGLYDALAAGTMDAPALRELVGRWPLDDGQPIYALDTSVWPRDDAETSPGRGYHYSASRQSAGQPIVAGWSCGWLAQVSFTHDSWTAPLDVRRVAPTDDAHAVAAEQIRDLLGRLPTDGPTPLCVFDAGYDPEKLARGLGDLDGDRVAVLVRLRSGRCFYADPEQQPTTGRPRRHGGSSLATPRPPGGRQPRSTVRSTRSTGRCACGPGPTCTRRPRTIRPV